MITTRLGPYKVYPVGLGLWQASSPSWGTKRAPVDVEALLRVAWEAGVNLVDTAEVYGWGESERLLGEALRRLQIPRDEVVVASKVAGFRSTRWSILRAAEGVRRRLSTTPDIIQHHWPPPIHSRICTVARALEEAVNKGLAHEWALSNYNGRQLEEAINCSKKTEPVSIQVQYNLAYRSPENDVKPVAEKHGLAIIAWSPLAKGALAGATKPRTRAQRSDPVFKEASRDKELKEALEAIARKHGATRSQIALAWLIARGAIPIPGTRKPERAREYARAARIRLTREDIEALDHASRKYVTRWGGTYKALQWLRLIPSPLQYVVIRLGGGV